MRMKCPIDDEVLLVSSREGIEIDHCPKCRGVWLDRGELDKIIERAAPSIAGGGPPPPQREPERDRGYDRDDRDSRYYDDDRYRRKRKRGGFLEDLFDFD
jgi:Zn-finger nucleic acid-binding protein